MNYAPVVVFAYNRPIHLQRTLEKLNENMYASESDLFIFLDGPKLKKADDIVLTKEVAQVCISFKQRTRFKNVCIHRAKENRGLASSVISGVTKVINRYGSVIVVEDDLETSPYFLKYMNEALEYYKSNKRIWSISGYSANLKSVNKLSKDVYFTSRGCSLGWGTWKNRWKTVDWKCSDYNSISYKLWRKPLVQLGGYDMHELLTAHMNGDIDSWAVRWCYQQSKNLLLTVYPKYTLVRNIGCDGSGTHSGCYDMFETSINEKITRIKLSKPYINFAVLEEFKQLYGPGTMEHCKHLVKKLKIFM